MFIINVNDYCYLAISFGIVRNTIKAEKTEDLFDVTATTPKLIARCWEDWCVSMTAAEHPATRTRRGGGWSVTRHWTLSSTDRRDLIGNINIYHPVLVIRITEASEPICSSVK